MKKLFIYAITLILSSSIFSGCTDLEYEDFSHISSENFPSSEADLEAATIGVYHTLSQSFIQRWLDNSGWTLSELCTDELNTAWGGAWYQTDNFEWAPNAMSAKGVYEQYIKGVTKATRIIDAFENSSVDEAKKTKYVSELRVLRVLYAELLYDFFGAVPIVTDASIANDVYADWKPVRPSNADYVSFMISEILDSYENLDETVGNENYGRLTKGAALTLLMKIYLNDKQWQNAANVAQEIIDLKVYDLMPTYSSVFAIENEGPSNSEIIFPIQRITSNTTYTWTYFAVVMPATPQYKSQNGNQMQIWGGVKMPWEYYDKYESEDARLETIIRYYEDVNGNMVDFRTVDHPKATGAAPMKYSEDPDHAGSSQGNDFIFYRYADVLLSRAEALNEVGGPTQECIDLINEVRERSNATLLSLGDYTKETLRAFLLDERGRELYCEGHRRSDLIRFGKFIEYAQAEGKYAESHHVLYPIPQSALDENPNLVQNTGYEN
nr:RagB/SusD family nutrient uptake outer membrane protein [uncultured Carboxylicivirga sp.]